MVMPSQLTDARDLENFLPIIDPRRLDKPGVIKGTNFLFDVDGPRSSYNSKFYNWFRFDPTTRAEISSFRVGDEIFYGTPTGIWRIMEQSLAPELVLDVPVNPAFKHWPWTCALVGNRYYFAQHNRGLWQYNHETEDWKEINTPEGKNIKGVCESYGSLICLGELTVMYSSLDNGEDLTPSLTTGAGAQALSILSRTAFRVDPVADGIIVSTDKGFLKGEFVSANYKFRWYVLSRMMKSFSPNLSIVLPDIGLLTLDTRGFYVSAGKAPETWQPEMGEFLSQTVMRKQDHRRLGCVSLRFSYAAKAIFVSIAPNDREGSYLTGFVFYIPSGRWGIFSIPHHGVFDILEKPTNIEYGGFMGLDGFMHRFEKMTDQEVDFTRPNAMLDFLVRKPQEPVTRSVQSVTEQNPVFIGATNMGWADEKTALLADVVAKTGLYDLTSRLSSGIAAFTSPDPVDPDWS